MIRPLRSILLCLALARPGLGTDDPFANALIAPPDVRLYVHIEGAAAIRAELRDRPIARWLRSLTAGDLLPAAWQRLATEAGREPGGLFDPVFGRRVTVLSRGVDDAAEWVVLTAVQREVSTALLDRLAPVVLGPRRDVGLFRLPEHGLLLARGNGFMAAAPETSVGLLHEVIDNRAGATPDRGLAGHEAIGRGRALGGGQVGVFMRHAQPLGGWSVAVATLDGDEIRTRYASRFDHTPFRSRVTRLHWDPAPVLSLEARTLLSVIEPTDTAGGPFDAFVTATLGEPPVTTALGTMLGPRRITAVSDVEGRLEDPPFDLMFPTVARVYEVNDAASAWRALDTHMLRLLGALNSLGEGAFALDVPDPATFTDGGPRRVEIGRLATWLLGDLPGMDRVSLNWTVVSNGDPGGGGWCVIATHPAPLAAVADALRRGGPGGEALAGPWTSCGTVDGRRLASHLGVWGAAAGMLAPPGSAQGLREALELVGGLAGGIDLCRWRLARPSDHAVTAEAEISLSPPDSSR